MAKTQTHKLIVTVRFDRKCTAAHARREFADCIHGLHYPTQRDDSEPGEFRIGRVTIARKEKP